MKKVCAITGAAGGLGFGAAKKMGETHSLLISDMDEAKLNKAVEELRRMGMEAEGMVVDVSDFSQVKSFAVKAASIGRVQAVVHLAGLTALFAAPEKILRVNTFGTMFVNEAFYEVMDEGGCIMDICSISAYLLPQDRVPVNLYEISRTDKEEFYNKLLDVISDKAYESVKQGMAYTFSRSFIKWYVGDCCTKFGKKGLRVVSIAPGIVETDMSKKDMEKSGSLSAMLSYCPLGRQGKIDEAAFLISTLVDERNSYVNGVVVLCDGGMYAAGYRGQREPKAD